MVGNVWFFRNGAASFCKKDTVKNVSEGRHGGYEVGRLLSVVGDMANNRPKVSAIS